ncbi:MAG TPA: ice-binding family protein [Chthoniobacterales bacterium]|jgi:hypothetical protein
MRPTLRNRLFLAASALLLVGALPVRADLLSCGVDLGAAGRTKTWALFSLGGGIHQDDDSVLNDRVHVYGDMGVAGNGNIDITGHATLHGDLYYHTPGQLKLGKDAVITGMTRQNATSDALLNQGVTDATNASNSAWALPVTPAYASVTKINNSMTITGSGCVVLKLTDFTLDAHDTLTLNGTAGTAFILNITHNFSVKGDAQIVLGPGIDPLDVLFNVRGTGGDAIIDGHAKFRGILMANQRNAKAQGDSTTFGEIITNHIDIKKNAIIKNPRVVSE